MQEEDVDLKAAVALAVKVLSKTLDTNKLTPEKGTFCSSLLKNSE